MSLMSMKKSEQEKKEDTVSSAMDAPSYPYGLKIHLDEDSYEKVCEGEKPQVGDKYTMLAIVEVTDVHMAESGDDRRKMSASLQITDMALEKKKEAKDSAEMLYGSSEG